MEFGDFGLFELLAALSGLLYVYDFIKSKKWIQIAYTILSIAAGVFLFIGKNDIIEVARIITVLNVSMLVAQFWKLELEFLKIKITNKILKIFKKKQYGNKLGK